MLPLAVPSMTISVPRRSACRPRPPHRWSGPAAPSTPESISFLTLALQRSLSPPSSSVTSSNFGPLPSALVGCIERGRDAVAHVLAVFGLPTAERGRLPEPDHLRLCEHRCLPTCREHGRASQNQVSSFQDVLYARGHATRGMVLCLFRRPRLRAPASPPQCAIDGDLLVPQFAGGDYRPPCSRIHWLTKYLQKPSTIARVLLAAVCILPPEFIGSSCNDVTKWKMT